MTQDPQARECPRCGRPLKANDPRRHVASCRAVADAAYAAAAAAEGTTEADSLGERMAAAGIKPAPNRRRWR